MNIEKVKHIAISIKGVDDFYKESKLLKEDMAFFKMYTDRNKKSDFRFVLIPCQQGAYKAFRDIFEAYSLSDTFLEDAFAVYTVMKDIILDVYDQNMKYTSGEIREFALYLKSDFNLNLEDYVGDFVGCSHGIVFTNKLLYEIITCKDADKNQE